MNIWNKVFLGIIIVTAIIVLLLGGLVGSIRSKGQQHIAKLEQQIADTDKKISDIVRGADSTKPSVEKSAAELGLSEMRGQSITRFSERGRAWFGCIVRAAPNVIILPPALKQVEAQVIITSPFVPNAEGTETDVVIPETLKGLVYVFEVFENKDESGNVKIEKSGKFLGRFNVTSPPAPTKFKDVEENEKNGYTVTLVSADPISETEIDLVMNSWQSRWAIYLTPPVDRIAGIFDQMTDEEKIQMMTLQPVAELTEEDKQKFLEEFSQKFQSRPLPELTDAEKADVDPQAVEMWQKYRLAMDDPETEARDFSEALNSLYQRRSSLQREIALIQSDIKTYETAAEKNQAENEKLKGDCELEEKRVAAMVVQRDHVKGVSDQYSAENDKMRMLIEKLKVLQTLYAAKIAEYEMMAVEKIEKQINEE